MSQLADEQARRGFPAHQRVNGDLVTRLPKGGDPESNIGGVWREYSEDVLSSMRPKRETMDGEEVERHGLLLVPRDQTVLKSDEWMILGEKWQVERVGAISGGYRELYVQRNDKVRTSKVSQNRVI